MITLTHIIGMLVAAAAGGLSGHMIARAWPLARIKRYGAALLGALVAAPMAFLLQLFGAGAVGFAENAGVIDWPPVVSTLVVGGGCGAIGVLAFGMMRIGGRRPRRR